MKGRHRKRATPFVLLGHIYLRHVKQNLPNADVSAYKAVANYLGRIRPIMRSINRESDWGHIVADIRSRHKNRPRFMEILDRLLAKPIAEGRKRQR